MNYQRITETLPALIITKTSEVRVTETPKAIISTISITITADASTLIQTSIDVCIIYYTAFNNKLIA